MPELTFTYARTAAVWCGASRETRMPLALVVFFAAFPPVPLWSGDLFALAAGFDRGARFVAALPIAKVAAERFEQVTV